MSNPDPVDVAVGKAIRAYRKANGMTQADLSARIGVRFQQLQKYETAMNRISASRLAMVSRALGVPVDRFFEGHEVQDRVSVRSTEEAGLVESYRKSKPAQRQAIINIAKACSEVGA